MCTAHVIRRGIYSEFLTHAGNIVIGTLQKVDRSVVTACLTDSIASLTMRSSRRTELVKVLYANPAAVQPTTTETEKIDSSERWIAVRFFLFINIIDY